MEANSSPDSSFRKVAHYLLTIPTLLGLALLFFFVTNSARTDATDRSTIALASDSWSAAVDAIPAEMPAVWSDIEDPEAESVDDLDEETRKRWGRTNAFLFSCAILVILGGIGIALATAALTLEEPYGFALLRFGAILPVTLCIWLLWGFNLAFPGDSFGPFPKLYFGFPDSDPIGYGMGGLTAWTDYFYITSYAVLCSSLFLSFAAARVRSTSLFLVALPFVSLTFPLIVSWKWGAGWLEMLDNNYDFAGSALVHWQVGAAALTAGLVLTIFRKQSGGSEKSDTKRPSLAFLIVGGFLYFLGIIGMNAGSTLDSDPAPVAAVLQATVVAAAVSAVLSLTWWAGFRNRSPIEMFFIGLISGAVVVSGATDSLDWSRTLVLAALSGMIIPGLVVAMDRIGWIDPLAVGPVHGIAGLIGTLGTAFGFFEDGLRVTLPGQLTLSAVVPLGAILTTAMIIVLFGAMGFLFRDQSRAAPITADNRLPGQPPPLPPRGR